jgi:cellobiose phosphorylase
MARGLERITPRSPKGIATYNVEPYVVVADVYAVSPHIGRGGWTWHTGSAGWMYRLILESLLGLRDVGIAIGAGSDVAKELYL